MLKSNPTGDRGYLGLGAGLGLVAFADADGIDEHEVGFGAGVFAGDGLKVGGREDAGAVAFHLLKVNAAADVAEEDEDFERFDVRAGGDHVHGHGDAERGGKAECIGCTAPAGSPMANSCRPQRPRNFDQFLGLGGLAGEEVLGLEIDEEQVVAGAGFERDFAEGDATAGGEINGFVVLNDPAGRDELSVDLGAGLGFEGGRHAGRETSTGCEEAGEVVQGGPFLGAGNLRAAVAGVRRTRLGTGVATRRRPSPDVSG